MLSTRKNKVFSRFSENNHVFERDFVLLMLINKTAKLLYLGRSHISFSWFLCGSSILVELEFRDVGFCGGTKIGEPEKKKPLEQAGREPTTNTTQIRHRAGVEPRPH